MISVVFTVSINSEMYTEGLCYAVCCGDYILLKAGLHFGLSERPSARLCCSVFIISKQSQSTLHDGLTVTS